MNYWLFLLCIRGYILDWRRFVLNPGGEQRASGREGEERREEERREQAGEKESEEKGEQA